MENKFSKFIAMAFSSFIVFSIICMTGGVQYKHFFK